MARGAPEPQEDEAAAPLHNGARQRGWGREQLHERCRRVRCLPRELRLGGRINTCGERVAPDRRLAWLVRACDPHLIGERPGVELPQRCELGLAAEAAEPPVRSALGPPGYAVAVAVEGSANARISASGTASSSPNPSKLGV